MPVSFKGIAHPPARRDGTRDHEADLTRAEIRTADLGGRGTQVLVEHDPGGGSVGKILSSWEGVGGELRVHGVIDSPRGEDLVRSGKMRELSLGTSVHSEASGKVLMRINDELSLCERAARQGCHITELDGKQVATSSFFSSNKRKPPAPPSNALERPRAPSKSSSALERPRAPTLRALAVP